MCLISDMKIPSASTEDIKCYKILIPVGSRLLTPYRDFPFPIGEVVVDEAKEQSIDYFDFIVIDGGYFHSFRSLDRAKQALRMYKRTHPNIETIKIYNAIIPVNTKYYKGHFEEICSKALKIVDECND